VQRDYPRLHVRRDAHPKMHGLVQAEVRVNGDVDEDLRRGLFADPRAVFDAWIRFSNAFGIEHDLESEVRGMAIKVLHPDAPDGQDFLLATHHAFFMSRVEPYAEFARTLVEHPGKVPWFFLKHGMLRGFWAMLMARVSPRSPLVLRYFSQTPYRLGHRIVKLQARPKLTRELRASLPAFWRFWLKAKAANALLLW